jgi:hypothetical protein
MRISIAPADNGDFNHQLSQSGDCLFSQFAIHNRPALTKTARAASFLDAQTHTASAFGLSSVRQ